MEHTKHMLSIKLGDLVPSPFNVRRHPPGQVEELAALIAAQGLLHPLIVTEQSSGRGKARKPQFAVAAGERRRRALLLLQQQGQLPKTHEVLCELVPPERALELSVAENSGRQALHPADEFDAFKALMDEGKGVEDVAARFGVSVLTVQRRLKLAALSPRLLALYRQDGINLDQLMALALSDDHAMQERAWFEGQPWDRTPAALRRKLTADEVEAAGSALARFVGVEAYEAAGGVVHRDLFDDEQSRFLADPQLLHELARQKLETLAQAVRLEGWGWVDVRVVFDAQAIRQFAACGYELRAATPDEQAELDAMALRSEELDRQSRAMGQASEWSVDEAEVINLEEQDITARRAAMREALKTWAPELMACAGAVVTVSREGDAEVIRGLMREADRKAQVALCRQAEQAAAKAGQMVGEVADGITGDVTRDAIGGATKDSALPMGQATPGATSGAIGATAASCVADCSERLAQRLAAHKTAALQVMLSQNAPVALAALLHVLVLQVFGKRWDRAGSALQITVQVTADSLQAVADDLKTSAAWMALDASKDAWRQRLPEQQSAWLQWLMELPQTEQLDLLAFCTAQTVSALPSAGVTSDANALAAAVDLDMADWWEPTAQSYLNHVAKATIVQALVEVAPELADDGVGAMKKDVLVSRAASRLAGRRWLPPALRRAHC